MIKFLLVSLFCFSSVAFASHDCIPKKLSYIKHSKNKNKYLLKTVKGSTYEEAVLQFSKGMPKIGFLEKIKSEEKSTITNTSFSQTRKLKKSLNANVDMWLKYECKYQGEFYITAVIAKEDIKYVDFDLPKELTLKYLKKKCGSKKIYLLVTNNDRYKMQSMDKTRLKHPAGSKYGGWVVSCGPTKLKMKRRTVMGWEYEGGFEDENLFDNFTVIVVDYSHIRNMTADFWLELTKEF